MVLIVFYNDNKRSGATDKLTYNIISNYIATKSFGNLLSLERDKLTLIMILYFVFKYCSN